MIPLVDLKAQYLSIKPEIDRAIQEVIDESAFYKGRHVQAFEASFAESLNVEHCIGVANCTDGLQLALLALGIGKGDEVITQANTFIATSEAITATGAKVVFADIESATFNIDPDDIKRKLSERTRAILPVHIYGRACEVEPLVEIAQSKNLFIVEDCAHAVMAEWKGRKIGTIGNIGCFSFYPGKNMGAFGDAGAVVTDDLGLAKKIRLLANHGENGKHNHVIEGMSSRLDGLQAAILNIKLRYIDDWNRKRYGNALYYQEYLSEIDEIALPGIPDFSNHVFHLYVIRLKNRDRIRAKLRDFGIEAGIHYPIALPNLKAYKYLGHKPSDFPIANRLQDEILSLPLYPELTERKIIYIKDCLKKALKNV